MNKPQMQFTSPRLFLSAIIVTLIGCSAFSPTTQTDFASKESLTCNLRAVGETYQGTCEVTCAVNALAINFDGVDQKRACRGPVRTVKAQLEKTGISGKWLGTMQGVQPEDPTRFEVVENSTGKASVGRTPFGWFSIVDMSESGGTLSITMNANHQVRPTASDIAIIARAIELLPNESAWNKADNRQCPTGQAKLSLFCALQKATTDISGGIHYRQPALQAVREVLNTVDSSRITTHRIMDYNNHPATTLAEIHDLLRRAQAGLEKDIR
jgi:hypothetical protein